MKYADRMEELNDRCAGKRLEKEIQKKINKVVQEINRIFYSFSALSRYRSDKGYRYYYRYYK